MRKDDKKKKKKELENNDQMNSQRPDREKQREIEINSDLYVQILVGNS